MLIIIAHPSKSSPKAKTILLKFIQNPPKSLPNHVQNRYWIPNAFQNRPQHDFFDFLLIVWASGAPKIEPKSQKIEKKRWKIDVKKTHGFQHLFFSIFHGFGRQKRFQNRGFFVLFSKTSIFWKLAKTIEKLMVFIDFSGFEPPKINPKSMPKRIPKKHRRKTSKKLILASI